MNARTDIHRPSAPSFDPEAYDLVGVLDLEPSEWFPNDNIRTNEAVAYLVAEGFKFSGVYGRGRCDHCGAWLRYTAVMVHRPTQTLIYVGQTCLGNRFEALTRVEFRRLQANAKLARELALTKARFELECEARPVLAYATYADNIWSSSEHYWGKDIGILADIARKARQYGSISDKQEALLNKIMNGMQERCERQAAREAAKEAAKAAAKPALKGKQTITGTVTKADWWDNGYPTVPLKVTILTEDGTRYWGTIPERMQQDSKGYKIFETERYVGRKVRIEANFEPSSEDPSFGFFKRPTKGTAWLAE